MVGRSTLLTVAWRAGAWTALSVATALAAKGLAAQVWSGVLLAVAAVACQLTGDRRSTRTRSIMIGVATVCGLASTLLSSQGLGEVPVYFAASRVPFAIGSGWGRVFVVVDTIATGAVVGYISHNFVGVLAGLGIPLVAQRAVERRQLIASRDEAQALLVEVRAGREAEAQAEAQAAALRERGRIARELHDVLAHSLAGLSVQLQATRAIAAREQVGDAVLEPLDRAATLAKDGLTEARAVVGALRDPVGLGVAELPALVERYPGGTTLSVDGPPTDVPPGAGHAVYRAVQEALTNAARYAPGSPVRVELRYRTGGLSVCVADSGLPVGYTAVAGQGTGMGLAGMADRVREVGGTLTAGPGPDGGWQVRVQVPTMIRVVLADDQAVVRDGLVLLLSASDEVTVVGAAADGDEAVQLITAERPDVALLDLRMPKRSGAEVAAAIANSAPSVRVLVLTTFADDDAVLPALRAGALGYLTKDASGEELLDAIRAVAAGRTVLDPSVQRRLVELVSAPPAPAAAPDPVPDDLGGLTRREVDVVRLVAEGLSNQQIARRLVLGEATVKTHLNHVLSKLALDGRPGLVAWAWRHGLGGSGS